MELTIGKWKLWLCFPVALSKLMAEAAYGGGEAHPGTQSECTMV